MRIKFYTNKIFALLDNLYQEYKKKLKGKKISVLTSGGIDSSIIAYFTSKYFKKISFLTLISKESLDKQYVEILNKKLKQNLILVNFQKDDVLKNQEKVKRILEKNSLKIDIIQISLAMSFYLLLKKAKEEKIEVVFTGQGPDVLYAGYQRYQNLAINVINKKIKEDLEILEIDKKRDKAIADYFGICLVNPYLEKEMVDFSLKVPSLLKINKIEGEVFEKYLLRQLAKKLALPQKIILRHKKALQYSTKIIKYFRH